MMDAISTPETSVNFYRTRITNFFTRRIMLKLRPNINCQYFLHC